MVVGLSSFPSLPRRPCRTRRGRIPYATVTASQNPPFPAKQFVWDVTRGSISLIFSVDS
jgi:hypothetical protein